MNLLRRAPARLAGAAVLVLTASVTIGTVAPASGDDGRHLVQFTLSNSGTATNGSQVIPSDFSRCHLNPDGSFDPCVVPAAPVAGFDGTIAGDLVGVQRAAKEAVLGVLVAGTATSLDWPTIDLEPLEVTVAGCGTGSFVLQRDGNVGSLDATWHIVPHTGRGQLVGISGSGTAVGAFTGPGGTWVDAFVGRVRCGEYHD